jgi:ABC-type branched-subunit amino acid transport system substrate-binding protein
MSRKAFWFWAAACVALAAAAGPVAGQTPLPGITAGEIKIGQTMPYTGPVAAFSALGKGEIGYFKKLNDEGGITGRKINLLSLDDGYAPPKTVEQTRKLIEQEGVAFIFSSIGTAANTAIQKYLNNAKVPQIFIGSGADKFGNYKEFPWTMGGVQATFRAEARIYARHILAERPNAKIAILYQHDDFGRDYVNGLRDVLGERYAATVTEATYEFTDATVDSQIVTLQSSGADALLVVATPKFAAQAIRKVYDIGWKPMFFLTNVAIWVNSVMIPAGPEKGVGIISSAYVKDPTDPAWDGDAGMQEYKAYMKKYMPSDDIADQNFVNSYNSAMTLVQVLKQCGDDLARANVMRQAANLHDLALPMLLPGIKVNTSPTDYYPVEQMQLMRWNGKQWVRFGDLLTSSAQ